MDGDEPVPQKLVYPLEHAYTALELDFSVLKGADVAAAGVLVAAAGQADCGADRASPLWRDAHELAGRMCDAWPEHGAGALPTRDSAATGMMLALTRLGDTERIAGFLKQVVGAGRGYAKSDNPPRIDAVSLLPPDRAAALVACVVEANAAQRFAACADLLDRASGVPSILERAELRDAATALLAKMPPGRVVDDWGWRGDRIDAGFVADLLTALGAIDARLAGRAVAHMLDTPDTYGLDAVLVPAARDKLRASGQPAVARLRAACLSHLRARIALPLAPPADWQRPSAPGCRCPRCIALSRFLADGTQKTWVYRAVEADRRHVQDIIRTAACDLDTTTEKRGRPYSLICTKNQASYQRRVTQREQDVQDEASLEF